MWQSDAWWVRLWDFPRLQIAALLLIALILVPLAVRPRGALLWSSLAAGAAALAWQVSHFVAYVPPMPRAVAGTASCPEGQSLSLLNINVLQDNRRYDALLRLVEKADADVLLLLETDRAWAEAVRPLHALYPHRIGEPIGNTYGMLLFSKLPMEAQLLHRLQPDIPSVAAQLRLPSGHQIAFHGVHPEPPLPGDDSGERDAELVMVGRDVRRQAAATIVMGDLNDVAWSRTSRLFRQLAAVGDPRMGRGFYPTYHAGYPVARWPLDHLFATSHFALMAIERLDDIGSDHFPIFYRMCLVGEPGQRSAPAVAPPEVRRQAAEEVADGATEKLEEARSGE